MDWLYQYTDLQIVGLVWLLYLAVGISIFYVIKFILDKMQVFGNPFFSVTIIGTTLSLNAVLLIFVLIQSISTFQKMRETVNNELKSLYMIQKTMTPLSSRAIDQFKPQFREYISAVMSSEWKYMPTKKLDFDTEDNFHDFIDAITKFTPQNDFDRKIKPELISMSKDAAAARYLRIKNRGTALSSVFFTCVLLMQFIFIFHFALLTKRDYFAQSAFIIYQSILGVLLSLIVIYDHPFQGESGITAKEFQPMFERVDNMYGAEYR
jgi:hypothetical protein